MNPVLRLSFAAGLLLLAGWCRANELPIFDAHLHYSHDAWQSVPPKDAIAILRKAGVKRALVSSSNDDGTQMLLRPRVALDPYRTPVEGVWLCSSSTPPGAGVHGMCGWWAAGSAMKALGVRRR